VTAIRANTVLPADRHTVTLHTADGLELVGEIALPPDGRTPAGTLVCLHPLPTHGGSMDSHLYRKAAWRLPALADLAVLRFNTRGTESEEGRSQGEFDKAVGERFDVAAALDLAEAAELEVGVELPAPWLVGWSFGTDLVLMHGRDPSIQGAILISPPLRFSAEDDLDAWAESGKPLTLIVPEFDDYLRPDEARERFARVPQAEVVAVEGAKHLFVGYTERVLDEIVARVRPGFGPLPQEYGSQGDGSQGEDDEKETA
jgi:alpha/beta superfamily hydrolase